MVGDDRRLARSDTLEHVAVRNESNPLLPRAVARGEVAHVKVLGQVRLDAGEQLLLHLLGLLNAALGEESLLVDDLAADNLVDPRLVDLEPAELVGKVVGVAANDEVLYSRERSGRNARVVRTKLLRTVGERWSMVMCLTSAAMLGTTVAAVAPEPMTTTFLFL